LAKNVVLPMTKKPFPIIQNDNRLCGLSIAKKNSKVLPILFRGAKFGKKNCK
jgi:hypothetical protein